MIVKLITYIVIALLFLLVSAVAVWAIANSH